MPPGSNGDCSLHWMWHRCRSLARTPRSNSKICPGGIPARFRVWARQGSRIRATLLPQQDATRASHGRLLLFAPKKRHQLDLCESWHVCDCLSLDQLPISLSIPPPSSCGGSWSSEHADLLRPSAARVCGGMDADTSMLCHQFCNGSRLRRGICPCRSIYELDTAQTAARMVVQILAGR